jgi:hypothetical protein
MAEATDFNMSEAETAFKRTFQALASTLGEDSFKKYDLIKEKASGSMIISIFEAMANEA